MQKMSVSEFRQRCLALMDDLPPEGILITRHGHPLAKLVPVNQSCADLIGSASVLYDNEDALFSTGERWDAES